MKVAIVYDRVNKWGGAERVLLALHEIFPDAPLYTALYSNKLAPWAKAFPEVIPSFLNKFEFLQNKHEYLPLLMPFAFKSLHLKNYDLVISVTSEFAKNIETEGKLICYCLTPTRYLWSGYDEYFKNKLLRFLAKPIINILRKWDFETAQKPDEIIAISTEVQKRIRKYYKRESEIIFPPVELRSHRKKLFLRGPEAARNNFFYDTREFYLIVSRLVAYKKIDLAIRAFNKLNKKLVIVGTGREEKNLRKIAGRNIKFIGQLTDEALFNYYRRAKALILPQIEDFGLVAVEAQSLGCPVIAFKSGGALDTVIEGKTGVFFGKQTEENLVEAVEKFEKLKFSKKNLRQNAKRFSKETFKKRFKNRVAEFRGRI